MRFQPHAMGIINQGIARNPRLLMVSLTETSVDDNQFAICPHGNLPLADFHRRMSIDDVRHRGKQPELTQNHITDIFFLIIVIVRVPLFYGNFFIIKIRPLKSLYFPAGKR